MISLLSELRLAGSSITSSGRVEIFYNNLWGTICDDDWSSVNTAVICYQLGFEVCYLYIDHISPISTCYLQH